jgi:hypothetical protein
LLASTLMFSCAAAIFCEGDINQDAHVALARFYAFTLGTAMAALVVSVWLSMLLQSRMARYDMHHPKQRYSCGRTHIHFNDFYSCHCRALQSASFGTFVAGTACTLTAGGIYLSTTMRFTYAMQAPAWTFAGLTVLGVGIALAGLIPTAAGSADESVDEGGLAAVERERVAVKRRAAELQQAEANVAGQLEQQTETAGIVDDEGDSSPRVRDPRLSMGTSGG